MKKIELEKATSPLAEYAHDLEKEPVILVSGKKPLAALMPARALEISSATKSLAHFYAQEACSYPVILTRDGRPVAVLFDISDSDMESVSLSLNPEFQAMLERSRARYEREGGLSLDEVRKMYGIPSAAKPRSTRRTDAKRRVKILPLRRRTLSTVQAKRVRVSK